MNKVIELLVRIKNRFTIYYEKEYLYYKLRKSGVDIPSSMIFYGEPIFRIKNPKSIIFGNHVTLCSDPKKNDIGVNHPVVISCLSDEATIKIGDNTGISGASIAAMKKITIGKNCLIGANVMIFDNDFHSINPDNRRFSKENIGCKEVVINDNVFIGANSIVLKGVIIGKNSVIAAGSVVTSNVGSNSIYAGNPCRKIKDLKK